ncbi:HAD superfamily hydrolase (TIGR01509 family) [Allocatelliglobosispora scoriae]|uniref:HAD superfamily hydrolase (TIGR01509 family) n=1 Tax=Allocatelliglobosispora scoriae TaxID=643052 RepID=A0A841C4X1_9ACTN|nr:HAD-IA family hydrolase [Allocatelliglobosispora scoriae]MBB5873871.1 HAD superfamily hydrolase (TIGR01509 family) [Allocatelliglobosispora scoriae]
MADDEGTPTAYPARGADAVLFDFHGTLATTVDPVLWVTEAAAACGASIDRGRATVLADRLAAAGGLPGSGRPVRIPPQLAEVWANRDLYEYAHREAYTGLAATVVCDIEGFAEAVYERVLLAEGWVPYADALPTVNALREAGVAVGVVSNIGFDIRPMLEVWGFGDVPVMLSYEIGLIKPDPKIFLRACALLGTPPERTIMVGDTAADAGAVAAGCRAIILPSAPVGSANGLSAALALAVQQH